MNFRRTWVTALFAASFSALIAMLGWSLTASACEGKKGYPTAWWTEIPRDGVPEWEILPQDAGPGEVILSKRTELGVFSNFAATTIELDGDRFASLEGFWQMMKFPESNDDPRSTAPGITWPNTRAQVGQMTGFAAKDAGGIGSKAMTALSINWVTYRGQKLTYRTADRGEHYQLILRATRAKLAQHPEIKELLLKTGDLVLMPDHKQAADTPPAWKYFEIWQELRTELQKEAAKVNPLH